MTLHHFKVRDKQGRAARAPVYPTSARNLITFLLFLHQTIIHMEKQVRVRFAPSPTGPLHIGGVRTALYNYLFAKHNNGKMILRIEDTDQSRYVPGAESYIINSLDWCGIKFDEGIEEGGKYGPYRQSDRKGIYQAYALALVERGHAYFAFDTAEELEAMRKKQDEEKTSFKGYNHMSRKEMRNSLTLDEDEVTKLLQEETSYVIRIMIPEDEEVKVYDEIRDWVNVHTSTMDDKVLFKSDGMPTYHLANVVDDHQMEITHVIRGEEWLPSLPLHVLLYRYLGWENSMPAFAHLPLLLKPEGKGKLSKRDGDKMGFPVFPLEWVDPKTEEVSSGYRESGYFADAFVNILALLGWNPGTEKEIYSMEELIRDFDLKRVSKSGARFDPEKAKWFNKQYLMNKDDETLAEDFQEVLKDKNTDAGIAYIEKVIPLVKDRIELVNEFWDQAWYFFKAPEEYDAKTVKKRWKEDTPGILEQIIPILEETEPFKANILEEKIKAYIEENELPMGKVFIGLRICLVGSGTGAELFPMVEILGREETLGRIWKGLEQIGK